MSVLGPSLGPSQPATASGVSPTKIVVYENTITFLKTRSPINELPKLQTLNDYLPADSIVTAVVKSLGMQEILSELSSELGLANDPSLPSVLRTDEEAIATLLAFIFDSKTQEEAVLHLKGDSAQCLFDVVQDVGVLRLSHILIDGLFHAGTGQRVFNGPTQSQGSTYHLKAV
ncbi:hypothetical protein DFH07DRAFT_767824 [Mycena maculata]|uniref:Uncharacterized protein n=1 Tax=Mycena maculata TaxID=230809 RepID=A0AAD7NS45_9AGAR|nr:hypothetical protein DFH07DRAFT_767824 [Mycena maculata]